MLIQQVDSLDDIHPFRSARDCWFYDGETLMQNGRSTMLTADELAKICDQLAEGKSLRAICEGDGICERSVYRRLRDDDEFSQEYARARKAWADAKIEDILEIAHDRVLQADHKRVEIDTIKWAMGKLNGKYSDKVKHVGGDEGDSPIAFTGWDISFNA